MHVVSNSYGMYCYEARQRMLFYPPTSGTGYVTPYLWLDGDKCGSSYYSWNDSIQNRLLVDAPATITMWGDWHPAALTGTIYAQFRNDDTEKLDGTVNFVVTEDSIYLVTSYGDQWHNHVARDYLPTQVGEIVSIDPGDSITVSRTFTLDTLWHPERIEFVAWIQDELLWEDSSIQIWQGAILDIDELGIKEYENTQIATANIAPTPNPCTDGTRFSFTLSAGAHYRITLYDITGRRIRTIDGIASGDRDNVEWNIRNEKGVRVSSGVYLYRFEAEEISTTGKVIVR